MTNNIKTGPTSSVRADAVDAAKQQAAEEAKAKQQADSMKPAKGDTLYSTVGEPIFNTIYGQRNSRISFIGGRYLVGAKDKDAEEIKKALDYYVDMGVLTKQEG